MASNGRVVIAFYNLGGYHAARLRAAADQLSEAGYLLSVIEMCSADAQRPWGIELKVQGFEVHTLYQSEAALRSAGSRGNRRQLMAMLDELEPSVLLIPGWGFLVSRVMLRWARAHRTPTVVMSESKYDDARRNAVVEKLKSWFFVRRYNAAIVGGQAHADYLVRLGMPRENIFTGYDVVENTHFREAAAMARRSPDETRRALAFIPRGNYFLAATRFISRKNLPFLIRAYNAYREAAGDEALDLLLLGSGEQKNALEELVDKLQIARHVFMPGFISYDRLPQAYGLARAFIHAPLVEQWGLVVNESLASGTPVILSNTAGAAEMIDPGEQGWLFDPENQQELAGLLLQAQRLNSTELLRMQENCQRRAEDFAPEKFGEACQRAVALALSTHKV